jgi:signal transduction histidine kinase
MFNPFTQESEGYTKEYEGVGLGLPLTKRYLDLIGAKLKVDSEKGIGSTFTIIFIDSSS